jgi:predicted GNAT superfamily acetyltransferase
MKKKTGYQKFMELSDAEKDAAVAKFDAPTDLAATRPQTAQSKALHARARRKAGRPVVGRGATVVAISVERSLLEQIDAFARQHGMSRAAMLAMGAKRLMVA